MKTYVRMWQELDYLSLEGGHSFEVNVVVISIQESA